MGQLSPKSFAYQESDICPQRCTTAQLKMVVVEGHNCTTTQLHKCTNAQLKMIVVEGHNCTTAQLLNWWRGTTAPLHNFTTAQLVEGHNCTQPAPEPHWRVARDLWGVEDTPTHRPSNINSNTKMITNSSFTYKEVLTNTFPYILGRGARLKGRKLRTQPYLIIS